MVWLKGARPSKVGSGKSGRGFQPGLEISLLGIGHLWHTAGLQPGEVKTARIGEVLRLDMPQG